MVSKYIHKESFNGTLTVSMLLAYVLGRVECSQNGTTLLRGRYRMPRNLYWKAI